MKKQTFTILLVAASICIMQSCVTTHPCPFTTMSADVALLNSMILGQSTSYNRAFGVQGGMTFNVYDKFTQPVSLKAGVNVSMQGAGYEDDYGVGIVKGITRLIYANIPLTARYQFKNGFFAEAGIQPGILLSAKDKLDGETYDYRDWVKPFDLSIPLGGGYEFKNNIGIGLRVNPGITNINDGEYVTSKDRNFVIGLRGTYTFKKK